MSRTLSCTYSGGRIVIQCTNRKDCTGKEEKTAIGNLAAGRNEDMGRTRTN